RQRADRPVGPLPVRPAAQVVIGPSCGRPGCTPAARAENSSVDRPGRFRVRRAPSVRKTGTEDVFRKGWRKVHLAGLEPATFGSVDRSAIALSSEESRFSGGECPSVAVQLPTDPNLAHLCSIWSALPEHVRQTILTLAEGCR